MSAPCERCQQLEQMLKRAETDMAELGEQLAGVQLQARRAGQAEVAIRRQLQEAMEADPKSEQIRDVLNHWQAHHPRAKTPTGGKRFVTVKKALKLGFTVDQLKQALDGLRALPYVGPAGRMAVGKPDQRFDDVEHALRDEQTIERFIGYLENPPAAASRTTEPKPRPPLVGQAIDRVLGKLNTAKPAGLGKWTACCPAHEDRTASLSIALGDRGVVARCFAGCTTEAIADAIGVPLFEWFDDEPTPMRPRPVAVPQVLPSDATLAGWRKRLMAYTAMLERLYELRGWTRDALALLGVGWDGQRLTLPIHDADGQLINVCRYLPIVPSGTSKMLGLRHRPRGLFPDIQRTFSHRGPIWLVEGEPDAITGWSLGLPTVGVPGANGWRSEWATRFAGRDVVIVPDCDDPGRKLADQIAMNLYGICSSVRVVDLDPARSDGYDLSDAVRDGATADVLRGMAEQVLAVNRLEAA